MVLFAFVISAMRFAAEVIHETIALRAEVNRRYPGLAHSE